MRGAACVAGTGQFGVCVVWFNSQKKMPLIRSRHAGRAVCTRARARGSGVSGGGWGPCPGPRLCRRARSRAETPRAAASSAQAQPSPLGVPQGPHRHPRRPDSGAACARHTGTQVVPGRRRVALSPSALGSTVWLQKCLRASVCPSSVCVQSEGTGDTVLTGRVTPWSPRGALGLCSPSVHSSSGQSPHGLSEVRCWPPGRVWTVTLLRRS